MQCKSLRRVGVATFSRNVGRQLPDSSQPSGLRAALAGSIRLYLSSGDQRINGDTEQVEEATAGAMWARQGGERDSEGAENKGLGDT
jgi:hypothetical protein